MIQQANMLFEQFLAFSKANPIVAGGLGLWGLSILTFALRDVPARIWASIVYQSTTTLDLNSQDDIFYQVLDWVSKNKLHSFVRTLNLNNGGKSGRRSYDPSESNAPSGLSIGYGRMFFFHKKHFFTLYRNKDSSNQSEKVKEVMSIRVLGRNQTIFGELFKEISQLAKDDSLYTKIYTYYPGDEYWGSSIKQFKRHPETVAIAADIETRLFQGIDSFLSSKEWYAKNGVPYRLGILLEGPPGTGKTSLIKAICAKYDRPLYMLNLGSLTDTSLLQALSSLPEGAVCAIEDIDVQGVNVKRKEGSEETNMPKLSISGILNGLDGVASSEDRIVIATTNRPEQLDPAIIRPGRIDIRLTIGNMDPQTFTKYMSRMYPGFVLPEDFTFPEGISGARVQQLVFQNKDNYMPVLEALV